MSDQQTKKKVKQVVTSALTALDRLRPRGLIQSKAEQVAGEPGWKAGEEMALFTRQFEQAWTRCLRNQLKE